VQFRLGFVSTSDVIMVFWVLLEDSVLGCLGVVGQETWGYSYPHRLALLRQSQEMSIRGIKLTGKQPAIELTQRNHY